MTELELKAMLEEIDGLTVQSMGPIEDEYLGSCFEFEVHHPDIDGPIYLIANESNIKPAVNIIRRTIQQEKVQHNSI